MGWERKTQPTPFEAARINGLYFLDGDVVARQYRQEWVKDQKYPMIVFPSGITREVWQRTDESVVHIFGALDLPVKSTRDEAYALVAASEHGVLAGRRGERELSITNPHSGRSYHISYDNKTRQMANVALYPQEAMELLDGESRALLPPLYHNEDIGLKAIAPVKFFTPAGSWTWYASEGSPVDEDGYYDTDKEKVDYIFFGLVSGFEVELGYFALSELESVRGPLGLPIERDLYYKPKPLQELMELHQRGLSG